MRIHSDIINSTMILPALQAAQAKGHVSRTVEIDVNNRHGSRKRAFATELQIGSSTTESFISPTVRKYLEGYGLEDKTIKAASRRRPRQGKSHFAGDHLATAATWHEWGHFIAELFTVDPDAIVGRYNGVEDFIWETSQRPSEYLLEHNGRKYNFMADVR